MGDFYVSKSDLQMAKDIVSKSADLYIMPDNTPDPYFPVVLVKITDPTVSKITPTTSPVWTPSAEVGNIIILQDDNGLAREFVVADNDAVSLTFDLTSDVDGNDHSADFTNGATFDYRLWGTEEFVGWTESEATFTDEPEVKEFKVEQPAVKIREDVLERIPTFEFTCRLASPGILKAVHDLDSSNSNATYYVMEASSNPSPAGFYYLIAKNKTVDNKDRQLRMYYCQLKASGGRVVGGGEDYELVGVMASINGDPLRGTDQDNNNLYRVREAK